MLKLDDTPITKDDAVASGLPVGAAESETAKKKVRTDFGFGTQHWGKTNLEKIQFGQYTTSTYIQRTWKGEAT
jgi:hypothetical protein